MSDNTFIASAAFSVGRAAAFVAQITGNTHGGYLFVGDHRPSSNTTVPLLSEASSNTYYEPWQQMLYGKKVQYSSVAVQNWPYEIGTAYAMWDDQADMTGQQWYAVVNAGSYYHVFGCLDNANGANSTVQPSFASATAADYLWYTASDGYKWMYLGTTTQAVAANLQTAQYFPLTPNAVAQSAAVSGSVDEVLVTSGGVGYANWLDGTFQASDVRVSASPVTYQLSNSTISSANGFYAGCVMLITSGTGVGQFATVEQFYITQSGNFAVIDSPFPVSPTNGSGWELMPGVTLQSDGTQTDAFVGRALVNAAAANSVWSVQVLDRGAGYLGPVTASVSANAVVGVSNSAVVRAVLPPPGGHGANPALELDASAVLVGCTLSNTEGGLVPATNQYRQFGIVKDPLFANVQLTLANSNSPFILGESVQFLTLSFAANAATVNTTSPVVTMDTRAVSANALVLITAGSAQFTGTIASVTNSSSANLTVNSSLASTNAVVWVANAQSNGTLTVPVTSSNVFVTGMSVTGGPGQTLYGESSGSTGVITAVTRNGVSKSANTFVQLTALQFTSLGGSFSQNEVVLQGNSTALVHSVNGSLLYVSNMSAPFVVSGNNVVGNTSGAVGRVTGVLGPELVRGSGLIEYLEGVSPAIQPGPNTSQTFVVTYQF